MLRRRLLTLGVLCLWGVLLGTLGTWSWDLGHGYSALWPALVVQVSGGIWFGAWGVLAAVLFPVASNALAGVGMVAVLGYIPANLIQGLLPAWAFRRFRMDPLLPRKRDIMFFFVWGAILPSTSGAILGAAAVILFGEAAWSQFPLLVWKWAAPHSVVASVIGIPVMRIFTPLWRDLHALVPGWWGLKREAPQNFARCRFRDLPLRLKLVLSMCGVGICPLLALSLYELASQGRESRPTTLFLTISLVAAILTVGWLSSQVIRPLLDLKERTDALVRGSQVKLGIDRRDEIGQVARAFEALLEGRRKAEEDVRRSEAQLQSFVQTAPFGITRASLKHDRFLSVNPALVKMLGYKSESEVLALRLSRDVYVEAGGREQLLVQVPPVGEYRHVEVRWKRKDGKCLTVRGNLRVLRSESDSDDLIIEAIEEDVTQQRLLEERLQQAQKMEAVGQLAGGVAHDFNNLLGVILGYSELLGTDLSGDPQHLAKLQAIRGAAERAAALTSQLLAFSRKQVLQARPVSLNVIVADTEKMLRRLIGENIELVVKLEPELGDINADSGQLVQVIINLAVNARDAMPEGGHLTIETERIDLSRELMHESGSVPPGRYAVLKVADTGTGMDATTRSRIFEPFFTTKAVGQGTGLGLATVDGIIAQSSGHILVYSEVGTGTRFEVFFPRASQIKTAAEGEAVAAVPPTLGGSETILLVEDAEDLRELVQRSLEVLGYAVIPAASGAQAIERATQHAKAIDLLLTDVVMPEMSGAELADRIAAIQPQAKVLYMSGYAHHASVGAGGLEAGSMFLQKPFSLEALAQKLREALGDRSDLSPT